MNLLSEESDRATSVLLEYTLILGMMAIFASLLIFSTSSIVETQTDRVTEEEMTLYGQSIASGYEYVDRLVYHKNGSNVAISTTPTISNEVSSPPYVASVHPHPQENIYTVRVEHISSDETVNIQTYISNADVETDTDRIPVNDVKVEYDTNNDTIKLNSTK